MKKPSLLSRLKNKCLLICLILLILTPTLTGGNQAKKTEVEGVQTVAAVAPTIIPTETLAPTSMPTLTDTPIPTLTPTDMPHPQRIYTASTIDPASSAQAPAIQSNSQLDNNNYYTNSEGNTIHSPANAIDGSVPAGATAQCGDGTYSFSASQRGTCSHHGGVASWL